MEPETFGRLIYATIAIAVTVGVFLHLWLPAKNKKANNFRCRNGLHKWGDIYERSLINPANIGKDCVRCPTKVSIHESATLFYHGE